MDRLALLYAFATGNPVTLRDSRGIKITGIISAIEREGGSGYCYNVRLHGNIEWIFVRYPRPLN